MTESSTSWRIAGSALAGAVAFLVGFYAGLFVVLSFWGLDATETAFVGLTGGFGSLAAAGAIAWTVSPKRRFPAFVTGLGLGALLVGAVILFDADALAMGVGGILVAIVASTLVRTGMVDNLARG